MNPRISKVIALMREDLSSHLTLPEMARAAGYTVSYFCAAFKAETGESPAHYYKRLRLEKASQLLTANPVWSVTEVAARVGFNDLSHFGRDFKQAFGVSPKEYQRQRW
jgi:transcriptional regulator GlxA family with amidase domain